MAVTVAQICNIALSRTGVSKLIDSIDDASEEARMCKLHYEPSRDEVLSRVSWPFATRRQSLALLTDRARSGWEFAYSVPSDMVAARYIWTGVRNPRPEKLEPFMIEDDSDSTDSDASGGSILLTDSEDAELVYTARIETPVLYPPLFVSTAAWRVAMELAISLVSNAQAAALAERRYESTLAKAGAQVFNEIQDEQPPESAAIAARR